MSLPALCVAILLTALLLGCVTKRREPIVFGLYDVPPEALADVKQAGFDLVTGRSPAGVQHYLDQARIAELGVLLSSSAFASNTLRTRREIDLFDRHSATWAWYLIDEPDLHDVPPDRVRQVIRHFQRNAGKPGVIVLASGNAAKSYGQDADLIMVDFYPVAWAPVSRFAKEMRLADFARGENPFMAVVQAFDWSHFSDVLGQTNGLRLPSIAEVRCMSYMALAHEARGLFFYSYAARTWQLATSPLWPDLKLLLQELRRFSALFAAPPLWYPSEMEYPNPARMYNEVQDGVMLARLYHLKRAANGLQPGYYFLMINTTADQVDFEFRVPFRDASIPLADETIPLQNGWLRRSYVPYEVSIFGPLHQRNF